MKIIRALVILVFGLSIVGCEKEYLPSNVKHSFFQCSFINYAWIYTNSGWVIDQDGNLRFYENPQHWNFPDNEGYITEEKLLENLNSCNNSNISVVSPENLAKYNSMVSGASKGSMSKPESRGADMGAISYCCYWFDELKGKYKYVLLSQTGDVYTYNTSKSSKRLDQWLKSIQFER